MLFYYGCYIEIEETKVLGSFSPLNLCDQFLIEFYLYMHNTLLEAKVYFVSYENSLLALSRSSKKADPI